MLDHHPNMAFNLESEFLVTRMSDNGQFPEIRKYREWLTCDRVFRHSNFHIDESLDYVELLNDFLNQKRNRDNKVIVGATVHLEFWKLRYIWPHAKYIYIYRDPRDVANSVVHMGWAGNVYVAADHWVDAEREWAQFRPQLHDKNWIEVRYEELIADSARELRRICDFLQVAYCDGMFDYIKTSTYTLPDIRLNYQWKTKMAREDVQRLEFKLSEQIAARGYTLSNYPKIAVSGITRNWLYLQSRLNKFLFRLKRYGTALTLQETLFRRLGWKELHQDIMRKMDSITDMLLK